MEGGNIFWLRIPEIGNVLTIHCFQPKSDLFSSSTELYNEALAHFGAEAPPLRYFNTQSAAQTLGLSRQIQDVDLQHAFVAVASVQGLHSVGLGSNKMSYERAARLSFAIAAALQDPGPAALRVREITEPARHAPLITCGRSARLLLTTPPPPGRRSPTPPRRIPSARCPFPRPSTSFPEKRPVPLDIEAARRIRSCADLFVGRKAAHKELKSHWDDMLPNLRRSNDVVVRDITCQEWPWQCWIASLSNEAMMVEAIGSGSDGPFQVRSNYENVLWQNFKFSRNQFFLIFGLVWPPRAPGPHKSLKNCMFHVFPTRNHQIS